jgi:hypothetical protein
MNDDFDYQKEQFDDFINNGKLAKELITISYGHSKFNCGPSVNSLNNLIPLDDIDNLESISKTWTDYKKILIMSFEDQTIKNMDTVEKSFTNRYKNLYRIIILRDVLNCFSSRFQALCNRTNTYSKNEIVKKFKKIVEHGTFFRTDEQTLKLWNEHYSYYDNPFYIIFNYNLFICEDNYKKFICDKLAITLNRDFYKEKSTFGHGSSFNPTSETSSVKQEITQITTNGNEEVRKLFLRFLEGSICKKNTDTNIVTIINSEYFKMLKFILNNPEMTRKLERFKIFITNQSIYSSSVFDRFGNNTRFTIQVCNNSPEFITINELNFLYYEKYLKYKQKYQNLKNIFRVCFIKITSFLTELF